MAPEIAATQVEREVLTEVESEVGIKGHHTCVAGIALCIGVIEFETFLAYPFFTIVTLPCKYVEVVCIDVHVSNLLDIHVGLDFGGEAATHVVVALLYIQVIAERTAEQYAAEEDALLQIHALLQVRETVHETRTH